MSYNFKSIADVDVVETFADNANILIEEDGAIKKVSKNELSLKEEFDLDISITIANNSEGNRTHEYVIANKKSFEEIKNKIINGLPLNSKVICTISLSESTVPFYSMHNMWYGYFPAGSVDSGSPEHIYFEINCDDYTVCLILNPDNTVVDDT